MDEYKMILLLGGLMAGTLFVAPMGIGTMGGEGYPLVSN